MPSIGHLPINDSPQLVGVLHDTDLPVVDREQLKILLMADEGEDAKALVNEIFDIFKTEGVEKLDRLDVVCQGGKLPELRIIVHFIAGSAGNLGLMRLNGFFRGIEEAIDAGRFTAVSGSAAVIRGEFDFGCAAFMQELL